MKTTKPNLNNLVNEVNVSYKRTVQFEETPKVLQSKDGEKALRHIFENDPRTNGKMDTVECFIVLLLNNANKVMGYQFISMGGACSTIVDVRTILQGMLYSNAQCGILCHNHPSGNLKPSNADKALTKRVVEAAKIMELQVMDHIILTSEAYFSFADNGEI